MDLTALPLKSKLTCFQKGTVCSSRGDYFHRRIGSTATAAAQLATDVPLLVDIRSRFAAK